MTTPKAHERTARPAEVKARKTQGNKKSLTEADAPSVERFPGILDDMPALAAEYLTLNEEAARIEKRKKEIRDWVEEKLVEVTEPIVQGDFFVAEVITSHKPKRISPERLLENGVQMAIIEDSYIGGEDFHYIKIWAKGDME